MPSACPVPSPAERRYLEIQSEVQDKLNRAVDAALTQAVEQARTAVASAGLDMTPPSEGFLLASLHQALFCRLCGADPDTFAGGHPDVALAIIRNNQNIARHYWGAAPADTAAP